MMKPRKLHAFTHAPFLGQCALAMDTMEPTELNAESAAMQQAMAEVARLDVKYEISESRRFLTHLTPSQKDALILLEAIVRETFIPEKVRQAVVGLLEEQGYSAQIVLMPEQQEHPPAEMFEPLRDGPGVRLPLRTNEEISGRSSLGYLAVRKADGSGYISDQEFGFLKEFARQSALVIDHSHLYMTLQNTQERLARAVSTLQEMTSFVGHEVRAPLSSIAGFAGIIEMQVRALKQDFAQSLDEKTTQEITDLSENADRIRRGVAKLAQATMLLGTIDVTRETVSENMEGLNPTDMIVENIGTVFERELAARQLGFCLLSDQALAKRLLVVNRAWFSTIFDNTIGNAIKYALPKTCINAHLTLTPDELIFSMENAIREPLPADRLNRLLEKGYRAQDGFGTSFIGVNQGLGLYFVNLIVQNGYGGSISVDSKPVRASLPLPIGRDRYDRHQFVHTDEAREGPQAQFSLEIRLPRAAVGLS